MVQKHQSATTRFSLLCFTGASDAYIVVLLFALGVASYFLTGGLIPRIERNPKNPIVVQNPSSSTSAELDVLQLENMQAPSASEASPNATSEAVLSPEE